MATKKSKASSTAVKTPASNDGGFTIPQQTIISLLRGAKASGLTLGEAQSALATTGADANQELHQLAEKGLVTMTGHGVFVLHPSQGGPQHLPQAPASLPPPPSTPGYATASAVEEDDEEEDDDLPWNNADMGQAITDRLDTLIELLQAIGAKIGAGTKAPAAAQAPAIPPPAAAPEIQSWGQPPASSLPQGYTAVAPPPSPPQSYSPPQQSSPAPWQQQQQAPQAPSYPVPQAQPQGPPPSYQQPPYQQPPQQWGGPPQHGGQAPPWQR